MKPEHIVDCLRSEADDCLRRYVEYFVTKAAEQSRDFNLAARIYVSLTEEEKREFQAFLRAVQTDVLGSVFDLLDNQAYPAVQSTDLLLTHGSERLNGDLTDILYRKHEEEETNNR